MEEFSEKEDFIYLAKKFIKIILLYSTEFSI
jgi:hypothetical protein